MARSSKIYVVRQRDGYLLGAFTVKHEMHTFAERTGWYGLPGDCEAWVYEVPDGVTLVKSFKSYKLERPNA